MDKDSIEAYREDFPSLKVKRDGKPPVYLDNACTTLVPQPVIDAMNDYYRGFPGCGGGRSRHWFAEEVTDRIEGNVEKGIKGSRTLIADFIHARSEKEIIFTLNTSHAINMVALGFQFRPGDVVLVSSSEHNSNLLPWLRLQKSGVVRLERMERQPGDVFDLADFEGKLKGGRVRLVSMAYTSNATGLTLPAREIVSLAHRYGARVLLDGAQTVPHRSVDVRELDVDFLAFSIHKMCGPRGVGVLFGKSELLGQKPQEESDAPDVLQPGVLGGGTVGETTFGTYSLVEPPQRFEVGIQNYPGQIAAGTAVEYLKRMGLERINAHETMLNEYLSGELQKRYCDTGWFHIIGPQDASKRGGIFTFDVKRPNAVGMAEELSEKSNIMIRDGVFCAHSYFNDLFGNSWTRPRSHSEHRMVYRVSFYFYNTIAECEVFLETLDKIFMERSYI